MGSVIIDDESGNGGGSGGGGSSRTRSRPLPEEITQSIAIANAKSVAEQPATLANLMLGNLVQNTNQSQQNANSNQQNVNGIQQAILAKVVNLLTTLGPLEAMSAQQVLSGNAVAEDITDIKGAVAALSGQMSNQ